MTHKFANLAYARLNLDFDQDVFLKEYDEYILPASNYISHGYRDWEQTRNLNREWGMVDPEIYDRCDVESSIEFGTVMRRNIRPWQMTQLLYLQTKDSDPELIKSGAYFGGTFMRNMTLNRFWAIKPKFKHLEIVKWILQTLPFRKIISIHCVSLDAGSPAIIHRDDRHTPEVGIENYSLANGLFKKGFIIIVLNLTDGGVPLYWSLDGEHKPIISNDRCYINSDWFLHGVPVCTSRRRQIRITGIPTDQLSGLIDITSKIEVPEDFVYDTEPNLYPG